MKSSDRPKPKLAGRRGSLLVEMLVGVSIMVVAMGIVGRALFQSTSVQRFWREDVIATKDLRHAASWFAGDALNAETTTLVDGAAAVSTITLTWEDEDAVSHSAAYAVVNGNLERTYDGDTIIVAKDVTSFQVSLSARTLTFSLMVDADRGTTDSVSLQTYLRSLGL